MDKKTFISQIEICSESHDVKQGVLLDFFKSLLEDENVTTSELIYKLGVPRTHLGRILKFFEGFLQPKSHFVRLLSQHKEPLSHILCSENVIDEKDFSRKLLQIFSEIEKERPNPKRELDQFLANPETMVKRALYLHKNNEIYKRKVLLLGDDDLTSVAISLLNTANKIHVVDIDEEVLTNLQKIVQKYNLPVEISQADFRTDKLENLKEQFDLVFTDPPYTTAGINLFLDRAISSIQLKNSSSIYFCYGNSSRATERTLSVQKDVLNKGLVLTSIEKNFNQYTGADSIGNGSSLYGCVATPSIKVPKLNKKAERIYTHE
jgi:N4-bis(aminopropyl)spermidine synthase